MPANSKYLSNSWQQFAKVSSGILGGYLLSAAIHLFLAYWLFNYKIVLLTGVYSLFLLWILFMIIPFWMKNGWKTWAIYLFTLLCLGIAIYYGKMLHPLNP